MMPSVEKPNILLVEDDAADQKLIKSMVRNQEIVCQLEVTGSAEEALDFLKSEDNNRQPELVILDLNMPGMGGREFLKHIKSDEGIKHIPVVILSCSNSDVDVLQSYKLQAAGFATKPEGLGELREIINGIIQYWFGVCRLPSKEC
jgi:CheY-like chemotaxis protein